MVAAKPKPKPKVTPRDVETPASLEKAMKTPAKKPGGTSRETHPGSTHFASVKRPAGSSPGRWVGHREEVKYIKRSAASTRKGKRT